MPIAAPPFTENEKYSRDPKTSQTKSALPDWPLGEKHSVIWPQKVCQRRRQAYPSESRAFWACTAFSQCRARHHRHRQPHGGRPAPLARPAQGRPRQLSLVRNAADDAALHHRTGAAKTGREFPDREDSRQVARRFGHRDLNDRAEEKSELQLPTVHRIAVALIPTHLRRFVESNQKGQLRADFPRPFVFAVSLEKSFPPFFCERL